MGEIACRACRGQTGHLVLDLGEQPACDYFPPCDDPGPDPRVPVADVAVLFVRPGPAGGRRNGTRGAEGRRAGRARRAGGRCGAAGGRSGTAAERRPGRRVRQSARRLMAGVAGRPRAHAGARQRAGRRGSRLLRPDARGRPVGRARRTAGPGGSRRSAAAAVPLAGGHRALRTVERAPARALRVLLDNRSDRHAGCAGLQPAHRLALRALRRHGAAGGQAGRRLVRRAGRSGAGASGHDARAGVLDPALVLGLQVSARAHVKGLHDWLVAERLAGRTVLGYGAASRAVALLRRAEADRSLLPAVADASAAKQGLRMPGTNIPVVHPAQLAARRPDSVLLFLADLLPEVRTAFPEIEAAGGRWVDVETLGRCPADA